MFEDPSLSCDYSLCVRRMKGHEINMFDTSPLFVWYLGQINKPNECGNELVKFGLQMYQINYELALKESIRLSALNTSQYLYILGVFQVLN